MRWPQEVCEVLTRHGWTILSAVDQGMIVEVIAEKAGATLNARYERRGKSTLYQFPVSVADPAIAGTATIRRQGLLRSIWWDAPRAVLPLIVLLAPVFLLLLAPFWLIRLATGRRGLQVDSPYPDAAKSAITPALVEAIKGSRYLGAIELLPGRANLAPYLGSTWRGVERTLRAIEAVTNALQMSAVAAPGPPT